MNAAETIAAAIRELEAARESHHPGPYIEVSIPPSAVPWFEWAREHLQRDKRTIDAQLVILRDAMKSLTNPAYMAEFAEFVESTFRHPLLLARAILGGDS